MKLLCDATIEVLEQVQSFIQSLPTDIYGCEYEGNISSVGKHMRHILDHFLAFQEGIGLGCIDYNKRNRDSLIELDPCSALMLVQDIKVWIETNDFVDVPIDIKSEISISCQNDYKMPSYLSREYCYLINHTVHHLAYASLIAKNFGVQVSNQVGLAPSTVSYTRSIDSTC